MPRFTNPSKRTLWTWSTIMMFSFISTWRWSALRPTISRYWKPAWFWCPAFTCPVTCYGVLSMIWIAAIIVFCSYSSLFIRRIEFTICFCKTLTLGRLWSLSSLFVRRPIQTKITICSHFILFNKMFRRLYSDLMNFFYLFEQWIFQWRNQHNSFPACSCPSRSSDSMNITFRISRNIKVDNQSDIFHIQSSRSDIGRHQYLSFSCFECVEGRLSFSLSHISVQ